MNHKLCVTQICVTQICLNLYLVKFNRFAHICMERYFSSLLVFVYYNFNTFLAVFYSLHSLYAFLCLGIVYYWAAVSALVCPAVPPKCSTCQLHDQLVHLGNKLID